MSYFFTAIYESVYALGFGYKRAFVALCRFFANCFKKVFGFLFKLIVMIFRFFKIRIGKYFHALKYEGKKFSGEVKRALPNLKNQFKENPIKGTGKFFKYIGHAFVVHEKFTRAVLSTVIPIVAVFCLLAVGSVTKGVTFALDIYVENQNVGTVKNETEYKQAEKDAKLRFSALGSSFGNVTPVYKVTLTTVNNLDDTETVCNNIISAVSDETVNASGIYFDSKFLCVVGSENTFMRVKTQVLDEYAQQNNLTQDNYTVEFNSQIEIVTGLYPANVKQMTAQELYDYLSGYSSAKIEHTVAENETIYEILEKYNITESQLLSLNKNLDVDNLPAGAILLIDKGQRNVSIKHTVTYIEVESIPFNTVTQYDNNLYIGTMMTVVSGSEGQDVVSYTDTFVDGEKVITAQEILRYSATTPINQLVKYGTMGVPIGDDSIPISPRLTRDQGGRFVWPAPDNCFWLSQAYNPYNAHYGIDIVSSDDDSCRGRRIVAVADGIVTMATYHYSWGYYIRVDHGSGVVTGYAHALQGSFKVNVGDYVKAGQHLSSIGTTGNSTGYHLHFEVWVDGTRVNPLPYVYSEYTGVAVK